MATATTKKSGKKVKRTVTEGRVYVQSTYNNTIITITDDAGDVIAWSSAGANGFKGAKKNTPYAAQVAAAAAAERAKIYGLQKVKCFVKGVGSGREQAIRAIQANGINVYAIKDVTPIPHGGCRPKKPRKP